jgi:Protein of unknown function (DUF3592)
VFTGIRGKGGIPALIFAAVLAIGTFSWDRLDQHGKGLFLAAAGVLIVLLQVRSGLHIRELLTTGARAHGVVVGAETSSDDDGDTYYARVRFTTRDGQTKEFTSAVGHASEPSVGDPRPVRYRPDDPEQAEVDKPAPWIFFGALSLLIGLALVVAGAFMYVQGSVPFMDIVVE